MYIETVIDTKAQALALINWKPEFLFWRDESGIAQYADKAKVESAWGIVDFFTCSHPHPRRVEPIEVRLLIGANAYAVIKEGNRQTDIMLSPGRGAPASLREYATDQRERAARILALADLAERAADKLESRA